MPVDLSGSLRGTLSIPIDVSVHDTTIQAIEDGINANEAAISALGTASAEDVGTALGDVIQLEDVGGGTPGLPAVDGSQLTGIAGGGHTIEDEGTPLTQRASINFVGAGVTATDDAGNDATVVTISGIGGGGHTIEEEGTPLTARSALNFVGPGVTATDNAGTDATDITVNSPASDPTGITGASAITNIVSLSQANYDAIGTPDASTLYVIEA